ncbi:MAG: hypothetical protein DRJ03_01350 [Chloroflexi bacterium]|nr:MAG: hypothetical protein DRJ03_01350 [Chloroflexota bacterium]
MKFGEYGEQVPHWLIILSQAIIYKHASLLLNGIIIEAEILVYGSQTIIAVGLTDGAQPIMVLSRLTEVRYN